MSESITIRVEINQETLDSLAREGSKFNLTVEQTAAGRLALSTKQEKATTYGVARIVGMTHGRALRLAGIDVKGASHVNN